MQDTITLLLAPPEDLHHLPAIPLSETPEQALDALYALLGSLVARVARERATIATPHEDERKAA